MHLAFTLNCVEFWKNFAQLGKEAHTLLRLINSNHENNMNKFSTKFITFFTVNNRSCSMFNKRTCHQQCRRLTIYVLRSPFKGYTYIEASNPEYCSSSIFFRNKWIFNANINENFFSFREWIKNKIYDQRKKSL